MTVWHLFAIVLRLFLKENKRNFQDFLIQTLYEYRNMIHFPDFRDMKDSTSE